MWFWVSLDLSTHFYLPIALRITLFLLYFGAISRVGLFFASMSPKKVKNVKILKGNSEVVICLRCYIKIKCLPCIFNVLSLFLVCFYIFYFENNARYVTLYTH